MTKQELDRLVAIEARICEIAKAEGLATTDIIFEIVPAQRLLEGMAYMFPTNFSHWSFGRDYERHRTIYDHTGAGIPYEQVWNFDPPLALLVETNPFTLNVLVLAHVYGHADFFLKSSYLKHGRSFSDVAEEARNAVKRFSDYEKQYGVQAVEDVIDAGMSIMWHQDPDPFCEEPDEATMRERVLALARAEARALQDKLTKNGKTMKPELLTAIERRLESLMERTPPQPTYDLLYYIINHSPKLKPWMKDVLTVIRNQARALAPGGRTKMLNEGWATWWHVRIMRQLFAEGLLTPEEHETFLKFHSAVLREQKIGFNWYRVGFAFYEYIKERWDKGQFGSAYETFSSASKRATWDTKAMEGMQKLFEIRSSYSDRMAVESLFTDEFIHEQQLYIYAAMPEPDGGTTYVVEEDDPEEIRRLLKSSFSFYGTPLITIEDGNYNRNQELYLRHHFSGYELDPVYRDPTLRKINFLWGKKVHLETISEGSSQIFYYNGKEHKSRKKGN